MGRKSIKENKSVYQIAREDLDLTREKASELLEFISADRIEKIENGKVVITPDDVMQMAKCYKNPSLCNYFCSHECAIGKEKVPEVKAKELSQITIETLAALNKMNKEKDRLLEIAEDGEITPDEYADFMNIKKTLDKISLSVESLKLWVDEKIAQGQITEDIWKK